MIRANEVVVPFYWPTIALCARHFHRDSFRFFSPFSLKYSQAVIHFLFVAGTSVSIRCVI